MFESYLAAAEGEYFSAWDVPPNLSKKMLEGYMRIAFTFDPGFLTKITALPDVTPEEHAWFAEQNIVYVGDLVQRSENELRSSPGGEVLLEKVKEIIDAINQNDSRRPYKAGKKLSGWPPKRLESLAAAHEELGRNGRENERIAILFAAAAVDLVRRVWKFEENNKPLHDFVVHMRATKEYENIPELLAGDNAALFRQLMDDLNPRGLVLKESAGELEVMDAKLFAAVNGMSHKLKRYDECDRDFSVFEHMEGVNDAPKTQDWDDLRQKLHLADWQDRELNSCWYAATSRMRYSMSRLDKVYRLQP